MDADFRHALPGSGARVLVGAGRHVGAPAAVPAEAGQGGTPVPPPGGRGRARGAQRPRAAPHEGRGAGGL